jgi:transcriptional regulator of acetoin/glycerol metabolism
MVALSNLWLLGESHTEGEVMIEWEVLAQRLGYADEDAMWRDRYSEKKTSIAALSVSLGVSRNTIRQRLEAKNIDLRSRGGANNNSLDLTDEVIEEVRRDGVMAVAKRLEINYTTLYKRLRTKGITIADLRKPATVDHPPKEDAK